MKITIYNVNEKWSEISGKLSDKLKNVYKSLNVAENAELYDDAVEMSETDDEWKEVVKKYDAFIAAVNAELDAAEKPVEKPKPQPKTEPKKEPKFKVGDKVLTDHHPTEVYTVVEIANGKYKLDKTSGWWSEFQLEKAKEPKPQPKPQPQPAEPKKPVAKPQPKTKTQPAEKPVAEQVIKLEPSVKLIMKYVDLLKKKKPTIADARRVANAFSKAITEREVRKTDKYAAEINAIKGKLLDFINKGAEIKDSHFDKYNDIANKQVLHPFVKIVRAYIKINGKENVKKQANTICTNIANLCKVLPADFEFMAQLKAIEKSLNNYIEGKTATPKMLQTELSGLGRIADNDEVPETLEGMNLIKNTRKFDSKFDNETEVRNAVIEELSEYNFVAENEEDVQQFFNEIGDGDKYIYGSLEQTFSVLGIEDRQGYIPVYDVKIESSYIDSGSDDYIYSVTVRVR